MGRCDWQLLRIRIKKNKTFQLSKNIQIQISMSIFVEKNYITTKSKKCQKTIQISLFFTRLNKAPVVDDQSSVTRRQKKRTKATYLKKYVEFFLKKNNSK